MGFFDKMFATKESTVTTPAPRGPDFIDALSLHLRGEVEPALAAYLQLAKEFPGENLVPFFISAIMAGQGKTGDAAANLRFLSQDIATKGGVISNVIYQRLVSQLNDALHLDSSAVAAIIVTFGDQLKQEGFIRECAVCFEIAKGLVPNDAQVLYKFGDTLHDLHSYDYAEAVLQEALKYEPNHWGAHYTYAVLLQDLGRFSEAISYYEKAMALNPDHAKCQNNYAAALMMENRLDEALAPCLLAAELDPRLSLARFTLGNIYLRRQEYADARSAFLAAIALEENFASAYFGLGVAEQALGSDVPRVRELFEKAVELNPSMVEAQQALDRLSGGTAGDEPV